MKNISIADLNKIILSSKIPNNNITVIESRNFLDTLNHLSNKPTRTVHCITDKIDYEEKEEKIYFFSVLKKIIPESDNKNIKVFYSLLAEYQNLIDRDYAFEYRDSLTQNLILQIVKIMNSVLKDKIVYFEFSNIIHLDTTSFYIIRKIIDEPSSFGYVFLFQYDFIIEKGKKNKELFNKFCHKLRALLEIIVMIKEWTKAHYLIDKLLKIKKNIKDKKLLGQIYFRAGMVMHRRGLIENSKKYYLLSYKYFVEVNDNDNTIKALNNLGNIYILLENYSAARDNFKKALELSEENQEDYSLGVTYGSMGKVQLKLGNRIEAIDYLKKSRLYSARSGFFYNAQIIYGLIGDAYYYLKDYSQALKYYKDALFFSKLENHKIDEGENLMRIGRIQLTRGILTKETLNYFIEAEKILKKIDYKYGLIFLYECIGNYYSKTKESVDARKYYEKSVYFAEMINNKKMQKKIGEKIKRLK